MLDYSSTAQHLLALNSSRVMESSISSGIASIPMAEAAVQGAEVSLQAVEGPAAAEAATANIGAGALADAAVAAEAERTDDESHMEPAEMQQTAANLSALDSSTPACTGEDCWIEGSSQGDPQSKAAVEDTPQPEWQQRYESVLESAAASIDAAAAPAESTAAAMVLQMAAVMLQAAPAVEIAAAIPAAMQPVAAAADVVAAAADAEHAVQQLKEDQPAEAAPSLLVYEAAVPVADVAAAAPVIAVLDDSIAEDQESADAALLRVAAPAVLGISQQQQQQQQHEELEAAALPTAMPEVDAAAPAAASAEAAVPPIWSPVVYLTPQSAQLLNEPGGLHCQQRRMRIDTSRHRLC
jgi:hypothetical protein